MPFLKCLSIFEIYLFLSQILHMALLSSLFAMNQHNKTSGSQVKLLNLLKIAQFGQLCSTLLKKLKIAKVAQFAQNC